MRVRCQPSQEKGIKLWVTRRRCHMAAYIVLLSKWREAALCLECPYMSFLEKKLFFLLLFSCPAAGVDFILMPSRLLFYSAANKLHSSTYITYITSNLFTGPLPHSQPKGYLKKWGPRKCTETTLSPIHKITSVTRNFSHVISWKPIPYTQKTNRWENPNDSTD